MNHYKQKNKGFALLYAILVSTIVLAVGLVLSNIITKQLIISSTSTHSQLAFYAANSAFECASYNDSIDNFGFIDSQFVDDPSDPSGAGDELIWVYINPEDYPVVEVDCENLKVEDISSYPNFGINNKGEKFTFSVYLEDSEAQSCGVVEVYKDPDFNGQIKEAIRVFGYSTSSGSDCGNDSNPRTVERIIFSNPDFIRTIN